MIKTLKTLNLGERAKIKQAFCDERFYIFGIFPGEKIEIVAESLIRGTIVLQTRSSKICVRREELELILEISEEKGEF